MDIGKISNEDLKRYVLDELTLRRTEVMSKAKVGMDCAVLDFKEDLIVLSTDPITGADNNIGKLAINVSVNDVSCEGAEPVGVLLSILLPPDSSLEYLKKIMEDANRECEKLNLDIIGGHTEITDAVNKPIITTTVIGRANRENSPRKDFIKEGDILCMSKYAALEGTAIIAHDKSETKSFLTEEEYNRARDLNNLISVLEDSKIAVRHKVRYMHDVTEGGILGAIWECSKAIEFGVKVEKDSIPILDVTKKITKYYKINPYKLISSGSMLMVFSPNDFEKAKIDFKNANINFTKIGTIEKNSEIKIFEDGKYIEIEEPGTDELYKII